jgi:hypothetical protein
VAKDRYRAAPGSAAFDRPPTDEEFMGYLCEALAARANVDDETLRDLATPPLGEASRAFLIATGQEDE